MGLFGDVSMGVMALPAILLMIVVVFVIYKVMSAIKAAKDAVSSIIPGCSNPPCQAGESCLQGAGQCDTGLYCNANSKCEAKKAPGEYCPGVAGGDYCISGQCSALSRCLDSNGKLPIGADMCTKDSDCERGWCGGVPIQCRELGSVGDYCPLDSSKCKDGLYCDSTSKCAEKRKPGEGCFTDSACASGTCTFNQCVDPATGKLPDGASCVGGQGQCGPNSFCNSLSKCEAKMGAGAACASDASCISGACYLSHCADPLTGKLPDGYGCVGGQDMCSADSYCDSLSKCVPKRELGEGCASDASCKSGFCSGLYCRDPNDPCRPIADGSWGSYCGNWDAWSGGKWAYVAGGASCPGATLGTGGKYWKGCSY